MRIVIFKTRNKDNKHLPEFKETVKAYLTEEPVKITEEKFQKFAEEHQGEFCRLYMSVNDRDMSKTQKALQHLLIDQQIDLSKISEKVVSLAAKKENALTKLWLFDIDDKNIDLEAFKNDVKIYSKDPDIVQVLRKTPNGYALIVEHGFDTRELLKKWEDVELKRDAYICWDWLKIE